MVDTRTTVVIGIAYAVGAITALALCDGTVGVVDTRAAVAADAVTIALVTGSSALLGS